jgi:flagellar hook protein FlgE
MSLNTSVSGLTAASTLLDVGAHNIANASTAGFRPQRVELSSRDPQQGVSVDAITAGEAPAAPDTSGTDLATEMVGLVVAKALYGANARAFDIAAETTRYLLDERA